jgi:hypothetical protein
MVNSFEKLMAQLEREKIPFKPMDSQNILSIPSGLENNPQFCTFAGKPNPASFTLFCLCP